MSLSFTPSAELRSLSDTQYERHLHDSYTNDGCPNPGTRQPDASARASGAVRPAAPASARRKIPLTRIAAG